MSELSFQTVQLQLHTPLKNETTTQTYTTISPNNLKMNRKGIHVIAGTESKELSADLE